MNLKHRIVGVALATMLAAGAWAPPCNYLVFPNACLDDYLETCVLQEAGPTVFECYTNASGCCGCTYWRLTYYCPLFGVRYGQESQRVNAGYGVCTPMDPPGSVSCVPTFPPGEG